MEYYNKGVKLFLQQRSGIYSNNYISVINITAIMGISRQL